MQTVIHSNDFALTGALDSFIRSHTRKSMRVCSDQIQRVVIRLKDINGPKGGDDKECSVEVQVANFSPIVVRKRSSDAYASIRTALGQASRTTLRQLGKRHSSKTQKSEFYQVEDQE